MCFLYCLSFDGLKNSTLKTIDVENYVENFKQYQEKYKNQINLKLGIEIGLQYYKDVLLRERSSLMSKQLNALEKEFLIKRFKERTVCNNIRG